jgi:hypothetical protein
VIAFVAAVACAALATMAACAGPGGERKTEPVSLSRGLAGLRLRVRREASPLDQEVGSALETELARAGASVATDDRAASDAELKLTLDLRSVGPVVEGIATVAVEHEGTLIDRVSTALDVYRRDRFPGLVAQQLVDGLGRSARVAAFGGASGAPPPLATLSEPAPAPTATPIPTPAATAPMPLGRAGRFGWGFSLELQIGWSQVFAPGGSPAAVLLGLAAQVDMGPRSAFRLPLSVVAASSGENQFAEAAFVPTYIYRFRNETEQTIVPYVGLGVRVEFVDAGRRLLGRPLTGMKSPDSCAGRHGTSTDRDCGFALSPEPIAGIEWHANRLFALDIAATYSFAHLTSSDGVVSWIHLLSIYVGPRLSF